MSGFSNPWKIPFSQIRQDRGGFCREGSSNLCDSSCKGQVQGLVGRAVSTGPRRFVGLGGVVREGVLGLLHV